ncbi:MAG: hypothetical protein HFH68_01530 [Lachnospiraceae bacterium]|nr:hypothetical protein [Lachnospiraceae bacterium]
MDIGKTNSFDKIHYKEKVFVAGNNKIPNASSSKGNQSKWVSVKRFIKLDTWKWYESVSEVFVSTLFQYTDIRYYIKYHFCEIFEDGQFVGNGCYSENFLKDGESCITFSRLLKNYGIDLSVISYEDTRDCVSEIVGFDIKGYLDRCLCLDAITFNEDRHLNNLSVIRTVDGYREAPVYDNGLSCLSDVFSYPMDVPLKDNLCKVYAMPFDTSFTRQLAGKFIKPVFIDTRGFFNSITTICEEEERALSVIKEGLKRTKGLVWEEF